MYKVERRKRVVPESTMGVYCMENDSVGTGNETIKDIHDHVLMTGHVVYRIEERVTEWVRVDGGSRQVWDGVGYPLMALDASWTQLWQ